MEGGDDDDKVEDDEDDEDKDTGSEEGIDAAEVPSEAMFAPRLEESVVSEEEEAESGVVENARAEDKDAAEEEADRNDTLDRTLDEEGDDRDPCDLFALR